MYGGVNGGYIQLAQARQMKSAGCCGGGGSY
jgi:hypothetical protein